MIAYDEIGIGTLFGCGLGAREGTSVRRRRLGILSGGAGGDRGLGLRVLGGFVVAYLGTWVAALVLGVGPNLLMRTVGVAEGTRVLVGSTLSRSGVLVVTVALSVFMVRRVVGVEPGRITFPRERGWWQDLLVGVALGAGAMGLTFAVERAAGWLTVEGWRWQGQTLGHWLQGVWLALLANLLAAVGEETLFRGYLLTGLRQAWGNAVGLVVMAVLFSVPHMTVTGAGETHWFLFVLLLALPGVMLGWIYLRSRTLWLPVGIHFAWNLFQDDVLNLTGSRGGPTSFGAVARQQGPAWFVGTSYGIEVGVAGVLALLLVIFGAWWWTARSRKRGRRIEGTGKAEEAPVG